VSRRKVEPEERTREEIEEDIFKEKASFLFVFEAYGCETSPSSVCVSVAVTLCATGGTCEVKTKRNGQLTEGARPGQVVCMGKT
jgi:hypothetical protein